MVLRGGFSKTIVLRKGFPKTRALIGRVFKNTVSKGRFLKIKI